MNVNNYPLKGYHKVFLQSSLRYQQYMTLGTYICQCIRALLYSTSDLPVLTELNFAHVFLLVITRTMYSV